MKPGQSEAEQTYGLVLEVLIMIIKLRRKYSTASLEKVSQTKNCI
jgi:hypothetical protein